VKRSLQKWWLDLIHTHTHSHTLTVSLEAYIVLEGPPVRTYGHELASMTLSDETPYTYMLLLSAPPQLTGHHRYRAVRVRVRRNWLCS
jgi:hypothetical protein